MNPRSKYLAGAAVAVSLAAGAAVLHESDTNKADTATATNLAGVAAGMRFNDDKGKARMPSETERAALAEAFQADIAKMMKGKKIPVGSKQNANGSVSAVVGTEQMKFLTVEIDGEGNAEFGHSSMDESGHIDTAPANNWPEM